MGTLQTGLLTPDETRLLIAASQGEPLLKSPPAGTPHLYPLSDQVGRVLVDTLAGTMAIPCYPNGRIPANMTVLVVNMLECPLDLGELRIRHAEDDTFRPVDILSGAPDRVPAKTEAYGGLAAWNVRNAGGLWGTSFALAFRQNPLAFPCGMSLGCKAGHKPHDATRIALEASPDPARVLDQADEDKAGAGSQASISWCGTIQGKTQSIQMNASLHVLDRDPSYLVVVSVRQA
jgi:hypothetical protein